jgi:hypothetical protein
MSGNSDNFKLPIPICLEPAPLPHNYNASMTNQIDQFFNPDGTLISIPVKSAKKIAVLIHIARDLSPTTKYPEKELNAIIAKYHDDTAAIRRHMIEYGILERDGESVYWLAKNEIR